MAVDGPFGGPSEIAARDLAEDAPVSYWERWSARSVASIRAHTQMVRCSCADGGKPISDGR